MHLRVSESRERKKKTTIKSSININTMTVSSTWGMEIQDNGDDKHLPGTQTTLGGQRTADEISIMKALVTEVTIEAK